MVSAFFGLSPDNTQEYKEVFLEHVFLLMYYMGFSYIEAFNIPIWQRIWFIQRINDEFKKSQNASKAAHQNTPDERSMKNLSRSHVPAKLRRFT